MSWRETVQADESSGGFFFWTVTSAAEGELLRKASSTRMLIKYFRSKLSQKLLGTRTSLWTGYIFVSRTTLVPRYLIFS